MTFLELNLIKHPTSLAIHPENQANPELLRSYHTFDWLEYHICVFLATKRH